MREADEARQLQTAENYAGFGTEHDERRKGTIMDVFHPTETAGIRLLKRMGWKEGQGIGPKVKRTAKLGANGQESTELHSFAPDDVPMITFSNKKDRKGLGCEAEQSVETGDSNKVVPITRKPVIPDGEDEDDSSGPVLGSRRPKAAKKKGAFGFGVLDDTGSDDDADPYSMGPKINYNRTLGGDKKPKKKQPVCNANPNVKTKPILLSKKLTSIQSTLRKCQDGRLPLDGFVLGDDLDGMASLSLKADQYKPPIVPEGWKSSFSSIKSSETQAYTSTSSAAQASTHTALTRAKVLNEATLPGQSIFDFISPAARDRLAAASGKANLPPALDQTPKASPPSATAHEPQLPSLPQETALAALSRSKTGFTPYASDLVKAARYTAFLEYSASLLPTDTQFPPPPGMSLSDHQTELNEFARAAEVFRPMSGAIANRFTTSSTSLAGRNFSDSQPIDDLISKPKEKPKDPAEEAALLGMFGHLTRSYGNWYPNRLLCKRFGVPLPDLGPKPGQDSGGGGRGETATATGQAAESAADFMAKMAGGGRFQSAGHQKTEKDEPTASAAVAESKTERTAEIDAPAIDPERNEALEQEKPGAALFKAVFGDDSDSE